MKEKVYEFLGLMHDVSVGCKHYSKQTDTGNNKQVEMCVVNNSSCQFWESNYMTKGVSRPEIMGDPVISKGEVVGMCRMQRDTIHLGPIIIFDRAAF